MKEFNKLFTFTISKNPGHTYIKDVKFFAELKKNSWHPFDLGGYFTARVMNRIAYTSYGYEVIYTGTSNSNVPLPSCETYWHYKNELILTDREYNNYNTEYPDLLAEIERIELLKVAGGSGKRKARSL